MTKLLSAVTTKFYLFDFKTPLERSSKNPSLELDVQFLAKDTYVSVVREQNLYVLYLKGGCEFTITRDGRDDISHCTIADFFERQLLH